MFSRRGLAAALLWWSGIIVLLVAGAIAVLLGLLWWGDASSSSGPTVRVFSGTVASVSSDPKFGMHVRLEQPVSADFSFENGEYPALPDVRVGDRVTIWAENSTSSQGIELWTGIKLQSSRGTWVDTIFGGDLNPPVHPPFGLMAILASCLGAAMILLGLVGAYRRYVAAASVRPDTAAAATVATVPPAEPAGQPAAVLVGAENSAPAPMPRAGKAALVAVALGCGIWLAALIVSGACPSRALAPLMWLASIPAFILAAVFARSATSAQPVRPQIKGGGWPGLGVLAIVLAVASGMAVPVGLWLCVFSCLG